MTLVINDTDQIRNVLLTPGTWAVVGLSTNTERTAHHIAEFLTNYLDHTVIPIHPSAPTVFDQQGYTSLADIPDGTKVDVVDCFVRSELVGDVVDQAIEHRARLGITTVWLQLGVIDEAAADRAAAAGLQVVMDTCPRIQYPQVL